MFKKKYDLSDQMELLSDENKTLKELSSMLGCSAPTIVRERRRLGIRIKRGLKKGQHNNLITKYITICKTCNKEFYTIPSQNAKYCSRKCMHSNEDYINHLKYNIDRSYTQTEKWSNSHKKDTTPIFVRYKNKVHRLSEKVYLKNKDIINPNDYLRTRCGVDGGYQLDHIISVRKCFEMGMTEEEASDLNNLQLLPWKENLLKR